MKFQIPKPPLRPNREPHQKGNRMNCVKCKKELPDGAVYCLYCGKKQVAAPRRRKKRANGTGNISVLSGKRAKKYLARRNNVVIGTYATYAEAQKALDRLTDAEVNDRFNMTFAQVYAAWAPEHSREMQSGMGNYSASYKNCAELHDRKFRSLRKSDYMAVIIRLEQEGKSKSSCEKMIQLFGQLSKWAMDEGITQQNHAQNVRTVAEQLSTKKPFTVEEIRRISESTIPAAQIALILIATGCRPNELFKVPISMCYSGYFVSGSKTTAGRERVIAVSPIGLAAYSNLRKAAYQAGGARLIDGYQGNRDAANFAKRDFKALMADIGASGMTPYNCRHTFITLAVKAGISPAILKRMVGHADISTTDKNYTHLDASDILSAAQEIDASIAVCNKFATRSDGRKFLSQKSS